MKIDFSLMKFVYPLLILSLASCKKSNKNDIIDTINVAKQAFTYGLPLVLIDITRRQSTNYATASFAGAPMNQFSHKSGFPTYLNRQVVRPNADTYYSVAFCDITNEAVVLSIPNTNGRYYMMPMLDAFTNVFASPGSRTGDTIAVNYLVTGPNWKGIVPSNVKSQIKSPTGIFWLIGRIQCNGTADGQQVVIPIQQGLKIIPLSFWGQAYIPTQGVVDPTVPVGSPNDIVKNMPIDSFFNYLNKLLVDNPPAPADLSAMEMFAKISVGPGLKFDISKFDTNIQNEMQNIPQLEYAFYNNVSSKPASLINGWSIKTDSIGIYGTDYQNRAVIASIGIGANLPADAVYPSSYVDSSGSVYNGANKYILHFDQGKLPPVNGFWSLTMYDKDGYFINNPINRYAIGHGAPLTYNPDGSLDIYIQNIAPVGMENNWLPAPQGIFNVMMRLYWPQSSVLNKQWTPRAITLK